MCGHKLFTHLKQLPEHSAGVKNVHYYFQKIICLHENTFPTENPSMTADCP